MAKRKILQNKYVKVSGNCWVKRSKIKDLIESEGGIYQYNRVTNETNIFVLGESKRWKYGSYGDREKEASIKISRGQHIEVYDHLEFKKLIEGKQARCLEKIAGKQIKGINTF